MAWTTACPDWAERIVARDSLVPSPPIHADNAAEALGVFKSLQMTDLPMKRGGGWPTMGEACEPFVFDLVGALFGAQDPKTGESLVKEAMLLISKKNGKSTIAAGIMLTALILNFRHNAELLVLAPTIEIANNSFGPAAAMVRADEELRTILHVIDHQRIIKHRDNGAELKIVAADAGVVGGKKAGFVLVDELWLFGKKPGAESMLEEATGGQAARPEGWTLYLSTHSDEPPTGIFKSKLEYARDVRDGEIDDPTFLPMLYEWPEELIEAEAYLDPANYYVTNPNLGKSPTAGFIERKIKQAQAGEGTDGDSTIQIVLAKYLNVEIGLRLRRDRWRGAEFWSAAADRTLTLEALIERSSVVVIGGDGGGLDDLYGLCVAGREIGTDRWLFWSRAWCWPDVLTRRKQIAPLLRDFERDGDLVICTEKPIDEDADYQLPQDVAEIVDICVQVKASGKMPAKSAIGIDAAMATDLVDALTAAGFGVGEPTYEVVPVGQGYRLMSAIVGLARKLKFRGAAHSGSPMMDWCVGNAKEEKGRQSVMINKYAAGHAKIDPFMAVMNATKLLEMNPEANDNAPSVYESRGVLVV